MKKTYTKPEIELVEYKANDVIMTGSGILHGDNDVKWLDSWTSATTQGVLGSLK